MNLFELVKVVSSFFLALVLSYYLTPIVREAALRFGIVDRPDGKLKKHEQPVPYLGGLAIFISLLATISIAYEFDTTALGILLGTTLIIVLGLVDDFGVLAPKVKLAGQLVAVWVLFKAGISVQIIWLPDWANLGLTVAWVLGVTNAFNLIDIMDGLSSGVAAIAALFLALISFINGNYIIAAFTFILAGSLFGFLPHNFRPASIYLGDTGSMAIGFVLAALTINEQYTLFNLRVGVLAPIIIMGVPIFETVFLIFVRLSKGLHPMQGSPDHFALRLRRRGWSVVKVVVTTYCVSVLLGLLGLAVVYGSHEFALVSAGTFFVVALLFALFLLAGGTRREGAKSDARD